MIRICQDCKFWSMANECHRSPPVRLPRRFSDEASAGNRVRQEEILWGWPEVYAGDWCGKFVEKVKIDAII